MTKAKFYGFLCLVLLLSNAFLLYNVLQPPKKREGPKKIIIEKLHLDEKQVAKYEQLITKHRKAIRKTERQILQLKQKLYGNPEANAAEKDSLIASLGQKQMEIERIHCDHFLEIKALCRADQQLYYRKLSKELARLFDHKPPHRK
ncbi:MAG: hypothetical protein ACO1O6_05120 [Bacteroidota bacterium]